MWNATQTSHRSYNSFQYEYNIHVPSNDELSSLAKHKEFSVVSNALDMAAGENSAVSVSV